MYATIVVNILSIMVNICIALYNVGKNRKIYGIQTLADRGVENINKELGKEDYTILHVQPGRHEGSITYILGRLQREKEMNSKKIIAREGLILLVVYVTAFIIAQNQNLQDWIVRTKMANPSLSAQVLREKYEMIELGDIILRRAQVIVFLSILTLYVFIRFILWAVRTLKEKNENNS